MFDSHLEFLGLLYSTKNLLKYPGQRVHSHWKKIAAQLTMLLLPWHSPFSSHFVLFTSVYLVFLNNLAHQTRHVRSTTKIAFAKVPYMWQNCDSDLSEFSTGHKPETKKILKCHETVGIKYGLWTAHSDCELRLCIKDCPSHSKSTYHHRIHSELNRLKISRGSSHQPCLYKMKACQAVPSGASRVQTV